MTAVIGVAERSGKLGRLVEPEDSEEDLAGGFVGADFEDVRSPVGAFGEVVTGGGDDVVQVVGFVFD